MRHKNIKVNIPPSTPVAEKDGSSESKIRLILAKAQAFDLLLAKVRAEESYAQALKVLEEAEKMSHEAGN